MPFKKKGKYYYSPSGKKFTSKQVKLYYATKGFNEGEKAMPKGKGTYGKQVGRPDKKKKKKKKELIQKKSKIRTKKRQNKGSWDGEPGAGSQTFEKKKGKKDKKKDWIKKFKKGATASKSSRNPLNKSSKKGKVQPGKKVNGKKKVKEAKKKKDWLKKLKKGSAFSKASRNPSKSKSSKKSKPKFGKGKVKETLVTKNDPNGEGGALNNMPKKKRKRKKRKTLTRGKGYANRGIKMNKTGFGNEPSGGGGPV